MPEPARQRRASMPPPRPDLRVVTKGRRREATVKAATDDYARQYAPCRALGHAWEHVGYAAPEVRPHGEYNAFGYVSVCRSCSMERTKWMSRFGNLGTTTYRPPEGYSRTGDARLSTTEWRRTWVVTVLGDLA